MATPGSRRKKSRAFNRSKSGNNPAVVKDAASDLLSLMSNSKDRAALKKMLMGASVSDPARAERIALKLADLAAKKDAGPEYLPIDQEILTQALVLSGLNAKGLSYVSPEKVGDVFSALVPKAFGEGVDTSFFNSEILSSLMDHAADPDASPLPASAKDALLPLLTEERRQALVSMVKDGRLQSSLTEQQLSLITSTSTAASPSAPAQSEPAQEPSVVEASPENNTAPVERAQLGTDSVRPDYAELAAQARLESERYQLDLDMQTDALLQLNDLMRRNPTWVNRSVREKLSDYLKDKRDGLIGRDVFTHPGESLFSETLAEVDETGRAKNEMVKFSNGPINGFKASFKSPNAPKDAYLAACYRLRAEGVRYPYIKTTFRDKEAAKQFLEMMVASLDEAGYHIDDIRVSPNLEEMFRYLKETKYPAFTLEEAPPGVVDTPDDPTVIQEQIPPELAFDRARRLSEEMLMEKYPELSAAEALQEELRVVNGVALKFADSRNDPERPLDLRDVAPKDMIEILSRRPLLAISGDSWNSSVHSGGLVPTAKHVVEEVVREFERIIDLADPRVDSGKAELGHHQISLLSLAKDTLMHVMPERAGQLDFVFKHIEGQRVDAPKNDSVEINPDATAVGPADYSPAEVQLQQSEASAPYMQSSFDDASSFEQSMQPLPPLASYENDMPPEWEQPFDQWSPPRYDAPPLEDGLPDYDAQAAFSEYPGNDMQPDFPTQDLGYQPYQAQVAAPVREQYIPEGMVNVGANDHPGNYTPDSVSAPVSDEYIPEGMVNVSDSAAGATNEAPSQIDAPEDISLPEPDLSRSRWDGVIGKELHEIEPELLRNIAEMTAMDAYHVQLMRPDSEWDLDAMLEFKNVVDTVKQITSPMSDATTAQSFGQREWDLLEHLPADVVPEGLLSIRNEYISAKQSASVVPVVDNEPAPSIPVVDVSAFKDAIGRELHEIPTDVIRAICSMTGDEASDIRGLKEVEGWDPLQLDELRNAVETIRLLHAEPVVRESDLGPRELALVRAMPDDLRPTVEVESRPDNDVSRPVHGPRP